MRTVRMLMAGLAIAALAACGTDNITAPAADLDNAPRSENDGATCPGVWVTVVTPAGSVQTCVVGDGGMLGSGG